MNSQDIVVEQAASAAKMVTLSSSAAAIIADWLFTGNGIAFIGLLIGLSSFLVQAILGILQYRIRLREHKQTMKRLEENAP